MNGYLRATHKNYGEALGITVGGVTDANGSAGIIEPLQQASLALKRYIDKVKASVEEEDSATEEQALRLLEPVLSWVRPSASRREEGEEKVVEATAAGPEGKVDPGDPKPL